MHVPLKAMSTESEVMYLMKLNTSCNSCLRQRYLEISCVRCESVDSFQQSMLTCQDAKCCWFVNFQYNVLRKNRKNRNILLINCTQLYIINISMKQCKRSKLCIKIIQMKTSKLNLLSIEVSQNLSR